MNWFGRANQLGIPKEEAERLAAAATPRHQPRIPNPAVDPRRLSAGRRQPHRVGELAPPWPHPAGHHANGWTTDGGGERPRQRLPRDKRPRSAWRGGNGRG